LSDSKYLLAYQSLLTGINLENKTFGVDRQSYKDGNFIFAFIIQSFEGDASFYPKKGTLKIELTFSKPLPKPVSALILAQTQNLLTIDQFRNIEVLNQGNLK